MDYFGAILMSFSTIPLWHLYTRFVVIGKCYVERYPLKCGVSDLRGDAFCLKVRPKAFSKETKVLREQVPRRRTELMSIPDVDEGIEISGCRKHGLGQDLKICLISMALCDCKNGPHMS